MGVQVHVDIGQWKTYTLVSMLTLATPVTYASLTNKKLANQNIL